MFKSVSVRGYRGLSSLQLDVLDRVNIITGSNNTGKSSLLEALWLLCSPKNPRVALQIERFRGVLPPIPFSDQSEPPWSSLFSDFNVDQPVQVTGLRSDGQLQELTVTHETSEAQLVLRIPSDGETPSDEIEQASQVEGLGFTLSFETKLDGITVARHKLRADTSRRFTRPLLMDNVNVDPSFPSVFISSRRLTGPDEDVRRYSQLELQGREGLVVEALKIIEPRLRRLSVIVHSRDPMLFGELGKSRLMPLGVMGEGMVRLTSIVLAIATAANGVVLIDEIENGLHYSVLTRVWEVVYNAASIFNVQVIASTHSLECIRAAHIASSKNAGYSLSVYRLERTENEGWVQAVQYDRQMLEAALQLGFEVRG